MPGDATIFIVDDDPSVRKSLTRLIRSVGWNVEPCASGDEFLSKLSSSGAGGCIILDLTMPDLTGIELCNRMAAQGISLPVIFLTGSNDPALIEKSTADYSANFVDYLTKPVDGTILLDTIRGALERISPPQCQ